MEKFPQIGLNLWVGIFLNKQTGRRMADKQRQQPFPLGCPPAEPARRIIGKFVKPLPLGLNGKCGLHR